MFRLIVGGRLLVVAALVVLAGCSTLGGKAGDEVMLAVQQADRAYKLSQWEKALSAYRKAANLDPAQAYVWFRIANSAVQLGRFVEAEAAYEETLELQPDHDKALYNLSNIRLLQAQESMGQLRQRLIARGDQRGAHAMKIRLYYLQEASDIQLEPPRAARKPYQASLPPRTKTPD